MTAEDEARAILDSLPPPEEEEAEDQEFVRSPDEVEGFLGHRTYIVTCAQNNTPVHRPFWEALLAYAEYLSAQILVIPMRYKNPTSRLDPQETDADYWWPDELHPYLVENELHIHRKLWVMGHMKIGATALNPLTGLEGMTLGASAIFGHPQLQLRTIPTPQGDMPKIHCTTGSVSEKNYSSTKAGEKGKFHHTHGAAVVRMSGPLFHLRSINWSEKHGCFSDVGDERGPVRVTTEGIQPTRAAALITGDEHQIWTDPDVLEATYGDEGSMVSVLRPKVLVRHDVLDSYAITHHHRHDPIRRLVKMVHGKDNLRDEMAAAMQMLDDTTPPGVQNVIVASNHHDHVLQWLKETDPKLDPQNALLYHELMLQVLRDAIDAGPGAPSRDAFAIWARENWDGTADVRFLARDESFQILGIELGFHGDVGANGTRGSAGAFTKIGAKTVIGHRHSCCIEKGCYQCGCMTPLRAEYTRGPSSWLNTNCAIWEDGKRQLIHIIRGEWR